MKYFDEVDNIRVMPIGDSDTFQLRLYFENQSAADLAHQYLSTYKLIPTAHIEYDAKFTSITLAIGQGAEDQVVFLNKHYRGIEGFDQLVRDEPNHKPIGLFIYSPKNGGFESTTGDKYQSLIGKYTAEEVETTIG
ncbi:MAG: hypothetical protein M0D57_04550 [Sphingobacteriales bacterium JAD_PAG50586_3]|nr:MAG: hypothetical protein M0D57_04550 [Sphingobacteriales bacterium JAD_PAG50586_3]